jgi:hypothetical protein
MTTPKMVGYFALGVLVLGVLLNMRDIKRYIRISTM